MSSRLAATGRIPANVFGNPTFSPKSEWRQGGGNFGIRRTVSVRYRPDDPSVNTLDGGVSKALEVYPAQLVPTTSLLLPLLRSSGSFSAATAASAAATTTVTSTAIPAMATSISSAAVGTTVPTFTVANRVTSVSAAVLSAISGMTAGRMMGYAA